MAWIETEDGYVNLATAGRVIKTRDGGHLIVDQDGEHHKLVALISAHIDEVLAPLVPDTRGSVLHRIYYDPSELPETFVDTFPIVAWRLTTLCGALPVFPGESLGLQHSDAFMAVIELPDGAVEEVGGDRYDNLKAAREALIARHRKTPAAA
jgi:hypothetical protein